MYQIVDGSCERYEQNKINRDNRLEKKLKLTKRKKLKSLKRYTSGSSGIGSEITDDVQCHGSEKREREENRNRERFTTGNRVCQWRR